MQKLHIHTGLKGTAAKQAFNSQSHERLENAHETRERKKHKKINKLLNSVIVHRELRGLLIHPL